MMNISCTRHTKRARLNRFWHDGAVITVFTLLVAILVIAETTACRKAGLRMDIRPELRLLSGAIPVSGPLETTYVWQVGEDFEPTDLKLAVFVHFHGEDGQIRWQDDHEPPIPTSQWKPGETIEYSRFLFIPDSVPPEEITISMGLYDHLGDGSKVRLSGRRGRRLEYEVGRFELLPASQLPEIVYGEGWYDAEFVPGQPTGDIWRWTRAESICDLEYPGRPCALYIDAQSPVELTGEPQTIFFELEGTPLEEFQIASSDRFVRKLELPENLLQGLEYAKLIIRVSDSITPAERGLSDDERELGLKVFRLVTF